MGIRIDPTDYNDWVWIGSAAAPPTNPATLQNFNATGIFAWRFLDGESLFFPGMQLSHAYKEGTDLLPHLHWCASTTALYTGTWTLEYVDYLDAAPGAALQAKKTITIPFNANLTAYQLQTNSFSAVISGAGRKISSLLNARLSLALSAGASCFVVGIDAHFQIDRFGSVAATAKN